MATTLAPDAYGAPDSGAPADGPDPSYFIPIRAEPDQPDDDDGRRIELVMGRWHGQDDARLAFERTVEEHVRMLAGQHYHVWSQEAGKFVDITQYLSDAEKRWREFPRANLLLFWFMLTHARMTERAPILSFLPASADQSDAKLAEVMDPIFKTLWYEIGMPETHVDVMAWVIVGMEGYLKTRVDTTQGPDLALPPEIEEAVQMAGSEEELSEIEAMVRQLAGQRQGKIVTDVLSPLECRGEWGPKRWHEKYWHIQKSYLLPEEVWQRYGVQCKPDSNGSDMGGTAGYLQRLLFNSGYYGAADGRDGGTQVRMNRGGPRDGYVCVYEMWERPCAYSPETEESAGGRLLVTTATKVLSDSVRPYRLKYTSPIRKFGFAKAPGRSGGHSSPMETLVPLQRQYNKCWQQILQHRALCTNPALEVDTGSGIDTDEIVSRPGAIWPVLRRPGVPEPIRYVSPPNLSSDVWKTLEMIERVMLMIGNVQGATGEAPTADPSGELIEQLRFNSDRYIGPTMQATVIEYGRWAEDVAAMLPTIWTAETAISYAGEDNISKTLTVLPEMFSGQINVRPVVESMLPEGRGEREAKIRSLYMVGAFGLPGGQDPAANNRLLELMNFPHLGRAMKPGGPTRSTAEMYVGKLLQGAPAQSLPILEQHNLAVLKGVTGEFMASPEFLREPPEVMQQFQLYWHLLDMHEIAQAAKQMQRQAQAQEAALALSAPAIKAQQQLANPEPGAGGKAPGDTSQPKTADGAPGEPTGRAA